MRPVSKKKPGDEVEFITSMNRKIIHTIKEDYDPYGTAKAPLIANLGSFCSYCEEPRSIGDIHVEHVKPKDVYKELKTKWNNFLLACNICNSVKGETDVDYNKTHFPHKDNTFLDFVYEASGRVKLNPTLPADLKEGAEGLYNLAKLGRDPFGEEATSEQDFRWKHRYESWKLAEKLLVEYEDKKHSVEDIVYYANLKGNWSVWFTVFKGKDEVRKALIENTPGTCAECFDAGNHYEPVRR